MAFCQSCSVYLTGNSRQAASVVEFTRLPLYSVLRCVEFILSADVTTGLDSTGSFAFLDCDPSTVVIMSLYDPHGLPLMVGQRGIQRIGSTISYMQTKAAEVTYSPLLVRFGEFFYKRPTSIRSSDSKYITLLT